MALILNIETSTTALSVAVAKAGKLLSLKELNAGYTHSENLTIFIQDAMLEAGEKLENIDAIAVSKGPGSYTGLRIGVSTAKGLCYALDKPLISVHTLQHLAYSVSQNKVNKKSLFCPMIDARRMEVYCALFDSQNKFIVNTEAKIVDELFYENYIGKSKINLDDFEIYFFGDGSTKCREVLNKNKNAIFIENTFPSAKDMISFSVESFANKVFEDIAYFEPFYLKDFIAGKKTNEK